MVVAVSSLPKVILYPILLLAFGLGISAKIAFGTLHGVIPIIHFPIPAVRSVRPVLVKTDRVLKLSPFRMVRTILFPAALPEIFTGLRVGVALTLIGVLLAEMRSTTACIAGRSGPARLSRQTPLRVGHGESPAGRCLSRSPGDGRRRERDTPVRCLSRRHGFSTAIQLAVASATMTG